MMERYGSLIAAEESLMEGKASPEVTVSASLTPKAVRAPIIPMIRSCEQKPDLWIALTVFMFAISFRRSPHHAFRGTGTARIFIII